MVQEKVSSVNQSVTWINCNSYKGRQSDSKYYRDWQECLPLGACDNTAGTERREGTSRLHVSHAGIPRLMEGPPSAGRVWNEALAMSEITEGEVLEQVASLIAKGLMLHGLDLAKSLITSMWSKSQTQTHFKKTAPVISVGSHASKGCQYSFHGLTRPYVFNSLTKSVACTIHRHTRGESSSLFPCATARLYSLKCLK